MQCNAVGPVLSQTGCPEQYSSNAAHTIGFTLAGDFPGTNTRSQRKGFK